MAWRNEVARETLVAVVYVIEGHMQSQANGKLSCVGASTVKYSN